MKRLSLNDFTKKQPETMAQLLGQVLGNCHDQGSGSGGGIVVPAEYE